MKLRVLVVDDEPLARDELVFLLTELEAVAEVFQAGDAATALALARENELDIAFVDLRIPGPDGLALAEALLAKQPGLPVVIVSAHDDGAIRAFEARVLDYLLKPVRLDRLRATLQRIEGSRGGESTKPLTRLAVRRRGSFVVVEISEVVYFEVKDELTWAVTENDRFALDLTLATLEHRLPSGFFRSHRGAIVRLDRIVAMEPVGSGTFELVLAHPSSPRVPLARDRARLLRELIPIAG